MFYRWTPVLPNQLRIVQNLGFRKHDVLRITIWDEGFPLYMYESDEFVMKQIVGIVSTEYVWATWIVVGFPTATARYKSYDFGPTPYKEALPSMNMSIK